MTKVSPPTLIKPELSRIVRVEKLGLQEYTQDFQANDRELKALTERFKIESLDALSAQVSLQLLTNGDVLMSASFQARMTQTCVVTLAPIFSEISSGFTMTYTEGPDAEGGHDEEEFVDLDDDIELSEAIIEGKIDIGEAVSEQLALEIDPFPRVKGAKFDGYFTGTKAESEQVPEKRNPFAVLSKLKVSPGTSE